MHEDDLIRRMLMEHSAPETVDVPPAGLVYWRAELRARRDLAEKALRPAQRMQAAAVVLLLIAAIAGCAVAGSGWIAGLVALAVALSVAAGYWLAARTAA